MVEWVDSCQPVPEWSWLGERSWGEVVVCRSVGWLVHDGDDVKAVAANVGEIDGEIQISGVIRIPARSVIRMVKLTEETSGCAGGASRAPTRLAPLLSAQRA